MNGARGYDGTLVLSLFFLLPMPADRRSIELLAPAKNADFGIEAINHGADAVYIGGPAFGARAAAGNALADIERLAAHAHRYRARVFVALNTILRDDELEAARRLAWQVYESGADALILQDMGLLEMDLPPLQLHASTQTDIRSAEKARFLQDVGFSQLVLARELSLLQLRAIAAATDCQLEYFIHGALCVAFSGQCYISHAHTGRSANRGECSQACRLSYDLADSDGALVASNRHLLSMKDNNQSGNLRALIDSGVSSFKIEGRYKDLSYVKNITAHYRRLLDDIIDGTPELRRASSGRCAFLFTPRPEKTFNRGYTDYFARGRRHGIEAFESPKFVGEVIGRVVRVDAQRRRWFEIERSAPVHNGDGLSCYDGDGELTGWRVNKSEVSAEGVDRLSVSEKLPGAVVEGCEVFRNYDHEFERLLKQRSAERRIAVDFALSHCDGGYRLLATDEDGVCVVAEIAADHAPANDPARAAATIREQFGKLGGTIFVLRDLAIDTGAPFIPSSLLNALRRNVCEALEAARCDSYRRPARAAAVEPPAPYPQQALSYLGNVLNGSARAFYARHGVRLIEEAYESNRLRGETALMITRHCLRYSFNLCPKEVRGVRPEPMTLIHGRERLTLRFDCKKCEMHVIGRLKAQVAQPVSPAQAQPQPVSWQPRRRRSSA